MSRPSITYKKNKFKDTLFKSSRKRCYKCGRRIHYRKFKVDGRWMCEECRIDHLDKKKKTNIKFRNPEIGHAP